MLHHILSIEKTQLLKIDNIGFSNDINICHFGPGQRDLYLIHYVIDGSGYFNGKVLTKGQGFLIKPNTYEHYYTDNSWKLLWITSRDMHIEEIFDKYNADKQTNIFEYNKLFSFDKITNFIANNHNRVYASTTILEMFLSLFHQTQINSPTAIFTADNYYDLAINYINSNIFRSILVNELASYLGISESYLYKIFIKNTSMSPKQYICNTKLQIAKKLLKSTTLQIYEIANSIGMDDQYAFSKSFKSKTGVSPQAYRKI